MKTVFGGYVSDYFLAGNCSTPGSPLSLGNDKAAEIVFNIKVYAKVRRF